MTFEQLKKCFEDDLPVDLDDVKSVIDLEKDKLVLSVISILEKEAEKLEGKEKGYFLLACDIIEEMIEKPLKGRNNVPVVNGDENGYNKRLFFVHFENFSELFERHIPNWNHPEIFRDEYIGSISHRFTQHINNLRNHRELMVFVNSHGFKKANQ